ncbi:alpha-amylase [Mucilaginibacter segetis]|uniref:Alpha-amylase n=1 Tax=Mucilaginibacter segetis TaxID=2793071 RepID=A0A934UN71_9SPHI|nr:alpha-amylase [Mucilaginibacter segetis]MBK0380483.1 alpha-amylase [Mucilaginibacter segetis]
MENYTMMQFFEWYYPADGSLWTHLKNEAEKLKQAGIDAVWLPPAHKGTTGGISVGYDSYDLYDLGEFDQRESVRTKYGTRDQLLDAVTTAKNAGLNIYVDVVLNHMGGAEETEKVTVRKVDPENRNEFISEPYEIEAFTKFPFTGRNGKYSQFKWNHECFSGVDYDAATNETAIFKIQNNFGDGWEEVIGDEKGNFDYLMLADIETRNPAVRDELKAWGKWFHETVKFDGMRLDAIKHMSFNFYNEWLDHMRGELKKEFFTVGEYWSQEVGLLQQYIEATEGRMSLFDAPLHHNFHTASVEGKDYDLTKIFENSLLAVNPELAVTLVENHDTQPLQALEAVVEFWFKPLAYALILLREQGYPCVFYADMYGAKYKDTGEDGNEHEIILAPCAELERLLYVRKHLAYGIQTDYFDDPNCIGWTRSGDDEHPGSGFAVLLSNNEDSTKHMNLGQGHAGKVFVDHLAKHTEEVIIGDDGSADFYVKAGSVSVWAIKG